MTTELQAALAAIDGWGAPHVAVAVVNADGVVARHGDQDHVFRWASVTKLATAVAVLTGVEDESIALDEPAGPAGSTVRHLLAHASGLTFDGDRVLALPGTRRIYSNAGFDALGALVEERDGRPFAVALSDRVLAPLGMAATELRERPSQGLHGPLIDAVALAREFVRPTLISRETAQLATTVAFPGLKGVLPGVGSFDPLDWGLGFELRDGKKPHWTGTRNSPGTFGHFGGSGTFVWVDPALDLALVCLTDREFDDWALEAWPRFSDSVIDAVAS
ncbi:MAG TPA: serine hydrolase domain-containing protein [Candidatus Limnocylindrales bacterium]|nr:serine hydrolase domain-containing protein [Candidatus Limnocylindrales bacterium]